MISEEHFSQYLNANLKANVNADATANIDASDTSKSMSTRHPSLSSGQIVQSHNPDTLSSSSSRSKLKTATQSQSQSQSQSQTLLVLEEIDDSSLMKDSSSTIGMNYSSQSNSTSSAKKLSGSSSTLYTSGLFSDVIQWMSNSRLVERALFGLESG